MANTADQTFAAITRQQYQDYLTNFMPQEDKLIGLIGNQEYQGGQVQNAEQSAADAYQSGIGTADRSLARYGVNMDPTERAAYERKKDLGATLSKVNAGNTIRTNLEGQDLSLMSSLANYGRNALGGANELLGNASSLEASRNATNKQISQSNKAANQQFVTSMAGLALMTI